VIQINNKTGHICPGHFPEFQLMHPNLTLKDGWINFTQRVKSMDKFKIPFSNAILVTRNT